MFLRNFLFEYVSPEFSFVNVSSEFSFANVSSEFSLLVSFQNFSFASVSSYFSGHFLRFFLSVSSLLKL